jgi:acyl-CoA dehydrogenase
VYAQLLLENARLYRDRGIDEDLIDQIFDFLVRDISRYALQLYSKPITTPGQMDLCQKMMRRPAPDPERYGRVWQNHILPLDGAYEMNR